MIATVLLVGLGDLGGATLDLLARARWVRRIIVASRTTDAGVARVNLARVAAIASGAAPDITFVPVDLKDRDWTAEVIATARPDVVYSTATMQSWLVPERLRPELRTPLASVGYGMWLPVHLALTRRLMLAVRAADYQGPVAAAAFPDVVHCALGKVGLAPTTGVGNVAEVVPKVALLAAARLGVPVGQVRVWLVGHHALVNAAYGDGDHTTEPPPFFVRVEHNGRDVTDAVNARALVLSVFPTAGLAAIHSLTAATTLPVLAALSGAGDQASHVPAPGGLPGGYPVVVREGRVDVIELPGCPLTDAIALNERSHAWDGIDRIEEDGTVVLREDSAAALRRLLNYDGERVRVEDADARATDLIERFRRYAAGHPA
jgi:hypothetical protein